ncbi:hypothetical protein [Bacillus inaquosorum]|uniref:hypothetical protein n=1 Tax=Bacillus inaquosorum TaxID=483913 RepID=UPI002280368D|nr:hypothetical protein [Bacillus inaquosorum]MCY8997904.1 hypothetical protein [Bacillus inaquosorum]
MTIEVKYLTSNGEYKVLETSNDVIPEDRGTRDVGDKDVWKKTLVSVSGVPEVKTETCHTRVRIPFNGRTNVPYPCLYKRTSKHWIELKVEYPKDLGQDIKDTVSRCALEAAGAAAATVAASVIAPAAIPAALPAAQAAFSASFSACIGEETKNLVSYDITHESESGEWERV